MTKMFINALTVLLCTALLTTSVSALDLMQVLTGEEYGSITVEIAHNNTALNNISVGICLVAQGEFSGSRVCYNPTSDFTGAAVSWPEFMEDLSGEDIGNMAKNLY